MRWRKRHIIKLKDEFKTVSKKQIIFRLTAILLSLGFSLCVVLGAVLIEIKMAKDSGRRVHHRIRKNKIAQKIFVEKDFTRLINTLNSRSEKELINTIWDFDQGIMLSRKMFVEQEMYGEHKYMYHPNIGIYNIRVWTGLDYFPVSMTASPEIEPFLRNCKVYEEIYYETDNNGFKKTEFTPDSSSLTIFFLGDSFTDGVWVGSKTTFVNQFGMELKANGISSAPINLGVNGYSASEMSWMLEKHAPQFHPHIVIVNLFPNDVHVDFIKVVKGEDIPENNYARMFTYLLRMKNFCEESGIMYVVAMIPAKAQLLKLRNHHVFQDRVETWSKAQKVLLLDPINYFDSVGVENVYFSWDLHFSPEGHKHYAKFLCRSLGPILSENFSEYSRNTMGVMD